MPDIEGVGEAVTGAMAGRAVERDAGEAADGHTHEKNCLNCGTTLTGDYCHACGQKAHVHRTISAWWHDFLHSVLHLDGKFWRTLPMLIWRPGELTRRYAHGERARFISPLALFLFTVFLMFAVFSAVGGDLGSDLGLSESVEEALKDEREDLSELESDRAGATGEEATTLDRRIGNKREEIARLEDFQQRGITAIPTGTSGQSGGGFFETALKKAQENPELVLYKLQANGYKFSWALIPISVPFLWILFLHRRRYRQEFTAYDHLVFVTYSIAFMSLALVIYVLLETAGLGGPILDLAVVLVPPLHIYRQLKGAYGLSRWSALWRTFVLLIFASIALSLFAMLLLALGAFA